MLLLSRLLAYVFSFINYCLGLLSLNTTITPAVTDDSEVETDSEVEIPVEDEEPLTYNRRSHKFRKFNNMIDSGVTIIQNQVGDTYMKLDSLSFEIILKIVSFLTGDFFEECLDFTSIQYNKPTYYSESSKLPEDALSLIPLFTNITTLVNLTCVNKHFRQLILKSELENTLTYSESFWLQGYNYFEKLILDSHKRS